MHRTVELVLGGIVVIIMGLGWLARRRPQVGWLQPFNLQRNLTDEQRARLRRTQNTTAGLELIVLGVGVLLAYFALKIAFFTSPTALELAIVGALSLLCVALGITALVRRNQ